MEHFCNCPNCRTKDCPAGIELALAQEESTSALAEVAKLKAQAVKTLADTRAKLAAFLVSIGLK